MFNEKLKIMKTKVNASSTSAKETIAKAIEVIVNEIITLCESKSDTMPFDEGKTEETLSVEAIRDFVIQNRDKMTSEEMAEVLKVSIMRIAGAKAAIKRKKGVTEKLQEKEIHVSEEKMSIKAIRNFVLENKDKMTSREMAIALNVPPMRIAGCKAALKREQNSMVPMKNEVPTMCEVPTMSSNLGGFNEYSKYRITLTSGCPNDCKYCYAKRDAIVKSKTRTVGTWKDVTCRANIFKKNFGKMDGLIGYQSTSDITPEFLNEHIEVLRKLLADGNSVLIVTKPRIECIKRICDEFQCHKENLAFRFSVGSCNTEILRFWEPNASTFEERLECLKYAFSQGYRTSISAEPLLDQDVDKLIAELQPFVTDTIWLGRMNSAIYRIKTNGHGDKETMEAAESLIKWQSNKDFWVDVYEKYKDNKKIVYKKGVRKILGIG